MPRSHRGAATIGIALILAACSGGGTATSGPGGAGPCADSNAPTVVAATVADRTWSQPVDAKVGDVITWANADSVPHGVELDDSSCKMSGSIAGGASRSLTFSKAGTYPFHCFVHPSMTGTITIT